MIGNVYYGTLVRAGGFMVSGIRHHMTDEILVLSGQILVPGHVLGAIMVGATATSAPAAGNTGAGVMGAVTAGAASVPGVYQVRLQTAGATGLFTVKGPNGVDIGSGAVGTLFNQGGLSFTLASGSPLFVEDDSFQITVAAGTMKYKEYNPANTDGSQVPAGILWDFCNATAGDTKAAAVTRACDVNATKLTFFSGATAGQQIAALYALQQTSQIVARASVGS